MKNAVIRQAAMRHRIKLWEIAHALGITDSSLSRKLRKELSEEKQRRILSIIDQLKEGAIS